MGRLVRFCVGWGRLGEHTVARHRSERLREPLLRGEKGLPRLNPKTGRGILRVYPCRAHTRK